MTTESRLILLADDHVIIRRGIKMILDQYFRREKIIETDSAGDIINLLSRHPVTHMILDMQLADGSITDTLPLIRQKYPKIPILIYTMSPEEVYGVRMMQMGVQGFLSKQSDEIEAVKALDLFFQGKQYISESIRDAMQLRKNGEPENPILLLSGRELNVLNGLLNGGSVKDISAALNLKATTVGTYKSRIFEKLQVTNVIDLKNKCDLYHYKNP
jgi:two-component system, NarL family, invasion response regulator UvrY